MVSARTTLTGEPCDVDDAILAAFHVLQPATRLPLLSVEMETEVVAGRTNVFHVREGEDVDDGVRSFYIEANARKEESQIGGRERLRLPRKGKVQPVRPRSGEFVF